jgi:hypothetical protein
LSLICLCGGYLLNYWLHDLRLSYWISSIIALLYHEFKKLFHKLKCSQTGCGKNRVAKLLPIDDENLMATINVANCQIHIRKVKINEKKTISFRITITHKTLRWHIWRSVTVVHCTFKIFLVGHFLNLNQHKNSSKLISLHVNGIPLLLLTILSFY